jgi:hypothetical protein
LTPFFRPEVLVVNLALSCLIPIDIRAAQGVRRNQTVTRPAEE